MQVLNKILGETSLETFLEKHFTKLPFSVPHGAADYLHLLNWPRVKEVLEAKKSVLRIVQDGKVIKDYVEPCQTIPGWMRVKPQHLQMRRFLVILHEALPQGSARWRLSPIPWLIA